MAIARLGEEEEGGGRSGGGGVKTEIQLAAATFAQSLQKVP